VINQIKGKQHILSAFAEDHGLARGAPFYPCILQQSVLQRFYIINDGLINAFVLLSFAKVMEHYPFYYIPLTLPSPPTTGERIKVRGSNVMAIFVPLFT
jgi:hypothetical protein